MNELVLFKIFIFILCYVYIGYRLSEVKVLDDIGFYGYLFLQFAFIIACWILLLGTRSFWIQWKIDDKEYEVTLNSIYN